MAVADFDVIVVGAGISGLNAAYRIQTQAPPATSYAILEARSSIGGTWDLFRYPGIRSDSDMFTFGFPWRPWPGAATLAAGPDIKDYLVQSAASAGIDAHIRYRHKVVSANWLSHHSRWELLVHEGPHATPVVFRARFVFLGTGYYDYDEPREVRVPGLSSFRGPVVHPQFWPDGFDCAGQDVVVIGSGATAVTIVPSVADKAKHVSMLQRSPTYIFPIPQYGKLVGLVASLLPLGLAEKLNRLLMIIQGYLMVIICRNLPTLAKAFIKRRVAPLLPPEIPWDPHFKPRYNPWEQRLCAAQDGDFFAALRSGKASVITDTIDSVTPSEIRLTSGAVLHPDVIVTATGLKLKFAGGIGFSADGKPVDPSQKLVWKASMLQDVPNLFYAVGYENASWTLGADCAAHLLTRIMWELRKKEASVAVPYRDDAEAIETKSLLTLSSTYVKEQAKDLPKAGTGIWGPRSHFIADMCAARWGDIKTGLLIK